MAEFALTTGIVQAEFEELLDRRFKQNDIIYRILIMEFLARTDPAPTQYIAGILDISH